MTNNRRNAHMKKMAAMLFALTLAAGMAFAAAESEGAA